MRWNLSYSYLSLPDVFYTLQGVSPVSGPLRGFFNYALARELGLGQPDDGDWAILAGCAIPVNARPFSQAYAGHQYGHFTMLGDGRALVLGEQRAIDGTLNDLQLKGSGPTPYSRNGDGRAALGPMLREYLMGEAMHALGIPTTRALAVVETGETLRRQTLAPGAVLTRVAHSHLRVGTFEFAAALEDQDGLHSLVNYALARHFSPRAGATNPAAALLEGVISAQARLVAQWMAVGLVHGVMNTDNMTLSGQTIDYGPCAFLDAYRVNQVFSSIDHNGRYSYGNQPGIAQWNLTRLAEALLPAMAQPLVNGFATLYQGHYNRLMAAKLGLKEGEGSAELVAELLTWMEDTGADYTSTFRKLTDTLDLPGAPEGWLQRWRAAFQKNGNPSAMAQSNPIYIPRNRLVQTALDAAEAGDYGPFQTMLEVVKFPFDVRPGLEAYATPPTHDETTEPFITYCGT